MSSADPRVANRPEKVAGRLRMRGLIAAFATTLVALAFSAAPSLAAEPAVTTTTTTATSTSESLAGYGEKPSTSTTTTSSTETGSGYNEKPKAPEKEEAPNKEEVKPKHGTEPNKEGEEPVVEPEPEPEPEESVEVTTESELPFTGYNLSWAIGIGLLLIVGGATSLWTIKRRERHGRR